MSFAEGMSTCVGANFAKGVGPSADCLKSAASVMAQFDSTGLTQMFKAWIYESCDMAEDEFDDPKKL